MSKATLPLWIKAFEDASFYRRMSKRATDPYKRTLLTLAANTLEELGDELYYGRVRRTTLEKLAIVESILKRHGIPSRIISEYRKIAIKNLAPIDLPSAQPQEARYFVLGL